MQNPKRVFYIYFHDTEFVPIHVAEVVTEMARQKNIVHLFAYKNVLRTLSGQEQYRSIIIHPIPTLRVRFLAELIFMVLLFPVLSYYCGKLRPSVLYVRHSAVSLVAILTSALFKIPCLLEINDVLTDRLTTDNTSRLKEWWVSFYTKHSFTNASLLLPVTVQIGSWIENSYRITASRICVVPNGTNINRFSPRSQQQSRQKYNVPVEATVLLSLGSLFPWAGMEILIESTEAIAQSCPSLLSVIGSGEEPYLSSIKNLVEKKNLSARFKFFGFIPWEDASWFIGMADLCIAPYILKNTRSGLCSLRVLSYLSCGKPVIGSDIPGLGDVLERENLGSSFPMGDSRAFANETIKLLSRRNELVKKGLRGREFIQKNHSWESIVNTIDKRIDDAWNAVKVSPS